MKDSIKNRKKNFLALCLSVMMLSSVAAVAACTDDNSTDSSSTSSSSSASTSQEKDDKLIKNSDFETYDEANPLNTTVTAWTRSNGSGTSGSATASQSASGVIDLSEEGWNKLNGTSAEWTKLTANGATVSVEDAEANWDKFTVKDKLAFKKQWEAANKGKTITKELSFYKTLNVDEEDLLTIDRFNTHHKEGDAGYGEDTKVLMIRNQNPAISSTSATKSIGTAQKYTSSSTVTVKAGTSAQVSVWVRTQDLTCSASDGSTQAAVGKGAYISLTHSVGSTSLDAYTVENINTDVWTQYTFYLKGATYTDTTFTMVLGLGQGGGTYRGDYVNGFAFFDDIQCETITNETYEAKMTELNIADADRVLFEDEGEDKIVDTSVKTGVNHFALDFCGVETPEAGHRVFSDTTVTDTKSEIAGNTVSSMSGDKTAIWLDGGRDGSKDIGKVYANAAEIEAETNAEVKAIYDKYLKADTTFADKETLLINSVNGVAYTASSTYTFNLNAEACQMISLFVKTSDLHGYTGAGITLKEGETKTSFSAIDTSKLDPVKVGDEKLYGDWQQYFFFVENVSETETATFSLEFNFGPTSIEKDVTLDSYHPGFAAFTNLEVYSMSKKQYASAQSGTYAKLVTVGKATDKATTGDSFDSAMGTPSNDIKEGFANPQNYKGVYRNDSAYVSGTGSTQVNEYAYAGLLNKTYFIGDDENPSYFNSETDWIASVSGNAGTATEAWNKAFDKNSTQPLVIWNNAEMANKSYGFLGKSTSLAANTYTAVSLRVKGSDGAKAYIRLVDTNDASYGGIPKAYDKTLTVGRNLTYWYDNEGNIWDGDPSEKASIVAFKLQTNGLYVANKGWSGYSALTNKDGYFANLNAYANADGTLPKSDLLVADGGASHDYNDQWNNEGVDGIAYYYKNGAYYADKGCTIAVNNIATTALKPRYEAKSAAGQALEAEITTTSAWTTVTFYIHTGDVAKNYRLELWSGDKAGNGNAANAYVAFDYNNPGTAETNFNNLLGDKSYTDNAVDKFESVFSYFDTASYLRYNASLDENNIGNLYEENYVANENKAGFAYLKHETAANSAEQKEGKYTIFADYQYTEKTVTASEADKDDSTEDSSDDSTGETNVWLLASSLAVAGVLLLAIASIVIQKIVTKSRKKRAAQAHVTANKKSKK